MVCGIPPEDPSRRPVTVFVLSLRKGIRPRHAAITLPCTAFEQGVLGKGHKIKKFDLLDFSAIRAHLETTKQIKRAATDAEKAAAKTVKEELVVRTVDELGVQEK